MKKVLSLLLATLMLLSLLTACSNAPTTTTPDDASTPPASQNTDTPANEPAATTDKPADNNNAPADTTPTDSGKLYDNGSVAFPLDDTQTVSMFLIMDWWCAPIYTTMAENPVMVELAERLNIEFDVTSPAFAAATEQLNLALVAEDFSDIMTNFNRSSASMLMENEFALDLTDEIPTYMPNYNELIHSDPDLLRDCTNDDGTISLIRSIFKTVPMAPGGLGIRADLLDDIGLEKPSTVEEMEPVLAAFRDMGMDYPYYVYNSGRDNYIQSAFDLPSGNFYVEGSTVRFAPLQDNFKDYLTLMNKWYEQGYINSDYVGVDNDWQGQVMAGEMGMGYTDSSATGDQLEFAAGIEGFYLDSIGPLTLDGTTENRVKNADGSNRLNMFSFFVTPAAEDHLDVVLSMIDYCFTEEGYLLCAWGVEGDSLIFNEMGEPEYNFEIINTGTYDNVNTFHVYAKTMWIFPSLANDKEISLGREDKYVQLQSVWNDYEGDIFNLPGAVNMTVEEQETYSASSTDAITYTEEWVAKFIMGIEDIETGFEDFRQALLAFGIEDAIAAQQSAYDRYMSR